MKRFLIIAAIVATVSATILYASSANWTASLPSFSGLTATSNTTTATEITWATSRGATSLTITVVGPATGADTDRGELFVAPTRMVEKCGSVATQLWAHVTMSNSVVIPVVPVSTRGSFWIYVTNHCTTTYEVKPL